MRGNDAKARKAAHRGVVRFVFKIDAFTPATIPMARLGEYMTALAWFLGEIDAVHFSKVTPGSTRVSMLAEREAAPKIRARAEAVRTGTAPRDVMDQYRTINKMLRDDKGTGRFGEEKQRGKILAFPGRNETLSKPLTVRQQGTFDGELIRVGGTDKTSHVMLVSEDQRQSEFETDRAMAKRLGKHLYEYVRLHGRGTWQRDVDGEWSLVKFKIDDFDPLDDAPLSSAIADLRTLADQWGDEAVQLVKFDRDGKEPTKNGVG